MVNEFNLSEKIFGDKWDMRRMVIELKDVKEFIKLLKEELGGFKEVRDFIDKIAGKDLI